jgi:hypothetical protein
MPASRETLGTSITTGVSGDWDLNTLVPVRSLSLVVW